MHGTVVRAGGDGPAGSCPVAGQGCAIYSGRWLGEGHRAPWPEGWRVVSIYASTGRAILTRTGEIKIVTDYDSYGPTREEKDYLEFLKGQLESEYQLALNDPHPHNEQRLTKLESQAKGLTGWSGDAVVVEALKDDVAELLARQ